MSIALKDLLLRYSVSDLKELLENLPGASLGGRKDDLLARILQTLSGDGLEQCFRRLDETQQLAVAEAVHDPLGEYSARRFQAKYGKLPAFEIVTRKTAYGHEMKRSSALGLFIHSAREFSGQRIPADLRQRLLSFVPQPAPFTLACHEELPEPEGRRVRLSEREAVQELQLMLRTIEQERVQVSETTAMPGAAAQRLLTEKLIGGDFYPWLEKKDKWDQQIGPIRAFAWPLLLQAGGLAKRDGARLRLSPQGVKAFSLPAAEVLRTLWNKWLKYTGFDEFSRIDAIKGQGGKGRVMTALAARRSVVEDALRECPCGRWISIEAFSRFMQAEDHLFSVTHDPWRLYLCDREYGSLGYAGFHDWNILEERYNLVLLFEYAATLGMIPDFCHLVRKL